MLPPPELPLAEAQLTATASMRDEGFRTNTALTANPVLDEYRGSPMRRLWREVSAVRLWITAHASGGRALGVRRPSSGVGSSLVRETPER